MSATGYSEYSQNYIFYFLEKERGSDRKSERASLWTSTPLVPGPLYFSHLKKTHFIRCETSKILHTHTQTHTHTHARTHTHSLTFISPLSQTDIGKYSYIAMTFFAKSKGDWESMIGHCDISSFFSLVNRAV